MMLRKTLISTGVVLGLAMGLAAAAALAQQTNDASGQPVLNQSVSLNDAVSIALKNSPSVASRRALAAAAGARVGMVKAMTRPQVSASAFGAVNNAQMILPGPPNVEPQNFNLAPNKPYVDGNLMAMYPVYTGGRLNSQVRSARAQQEASSADTRTAELDAALAAKTDYYRTALACKYIGAYQQRVSEAKERVRIAEEAYAAGRIAKYDLLRNQTDLAEARQQLINAQRDLDTAMVDLKNVMGISQSSQITLSQDLAFGQAAPSLADLETTALANRPEVAAARARLKSAQADLSVAKSAYKPQVYASAMTDLMAMKDEGGSTGYLVGVAAALPIFDGGLRKSAVNEAQSMIAQMQADEREAVLMVNRDIASSLAQLNAAAKNVPLSQAAVTSAEEDYRVIRMRYEAGKATNVEVLDALATLTRAQTMYAEALYNYNVARENLTRATGQR